MKNLLFVVVALAACSKSKDGGAAAGGNSCEAAIDNALSKMTGAQAAGPMAEMKDKLRTVFVNHCKADAWPTAVIDCFNKAGSQPEIKTCRQMLPADQAKAIQGEIMAMMMDAAQKNGGGGGAMVPMHGGGGGDQPPPAGAGSSDTAPNGQGGTPTNPPAGQ